MAVQLAVVVVLVLLLWAAVRLFSFIFRAAAVLFGSFVFLHWLARSSRDLWLLLYELAGMAVLLFLLAGTMAGLRRSRRW
jgi:hypothetical protein